EILREISRTWQEMVKLNQIRFEKGAINEVDLAKVQVAKLGADQDVHNATTALAQARVALAQLLAVRGRVPLFQVEPLPQRFAGPSLLEPAGLLGEAFD